MKPETTGWVMLAEDDYDSMNLTFNVPTPVYGSVCYHAQQCAEKYLKAYLYEQGTSFGLTHNLRALLLLCTALDVSFQSVSAEANLLNPYGVTFRYPDPNMKVVRATPQEAQDGYQAAIEIRAIVRTKLGILNHRKEAHMKLVSLNATNEERAIRISATRTDQTAIYKQPQAEAIWLGLEGLINDIQADKKYHGGPDKAICVYATEHLPHWSARLGQELTYGAFGENFSTTGLLEDEVCIGDTYRVGEVIVQVTEPRGPCNTLAAKWEEPKLIRWVQRHGSTGFYFRVLQSGYVRAGDEITLVSRPAHGITIKDTNDAMYTAKTDLAAIERVLTAPELGHVWVTQFRKRLTSRRRKLARQLQQQMAGV